MWRVHLFMNRLVIFKRNSLGSAGVVAFSASL